MKSNFADNLKKIRKENNLSQEQLADKLGVSRQSVSKWESSAAYPEMDKVLQLCKMFNLNIDELLNQNISEVHEEQESKNKINNYVNNFLEYITKTVKLFISLSFKDKVKGKIYEKTSKSNSSIRIKRDFNDVIHWRMLSCRICGFSCYLCNEIVELCVKFCAVAVD